MTLGNGCLIDSFAASKGRAGIERWLARLPAAEARALPYVWEAWARPNQLPPPGDWRIWLLLAGRGFGKTRAGAEWVRMRISEGARRIALVGATAADVRDVMVEGDSGIMSVCAGDRARPSYEPSKRRVTWPSGAMATAYSADEPDRLRGPQHDSAWADEIAAWRYPEAWDMLLLGLRLGRDPRAVVTTTPRPSREIKALLRREGQDVRVTRGTTYENAANLAPAFLSRIVDRYEGTRLGRQEIYAEILSDMPGALWSREVLEASRVSRHPELDRVIVAVDPAVTSGEDADETGILVAGLGRDGHAYVLDDRSMRASPDTWARAAVAAYHSRRADRLVGEANNGGDLVELTIRTVEPNIAYTSVHASRGKLVRAEPVAALYEQGRVHHVGYFPELEDQQCSWLPGGPSPDRMDALVWAVTELLLKCEPQLDPVAVW